MKIGICGIGQFSSAFIPLYQAHPLVHDVVLCDRVRDRADNAASRFGVQNVLYDFDELLRSGIDGVVILTEWNQFRALELDRLRQLLRRPLVVDLRNIYEPEKMAAAGFEYVSVGRPSIPSRTAEVAELKT